MTARAIRWLTGTLLITVAGAALAAVPAKVLIVLSRDSGAYEQVVQAVRAELAVQKRTELDITTQLVDDYGATGRAPILPPTLIITVGAEAARRVAQTNPAAPILHTLLPRETALEILHIGRGGKAAKFRDSAIFLDQPIGRQVDLLRLALPSHKRVAVILGPSTRHQEPELRAAARERSLILNVTTLVQREDLLPALEKLLDDNDILFSVAEPFAYNSETIHHLLLTTYRYKIPVMGLSKSYVDAGALFAIYSTPEQIGRQVAQLLMAQPIVKGFSLPIPSYPKYFLISVNRRVAASLDLFLDTESTLQRKLEALPPPSQ